MSNLSHIGTVYPKPTQDAQAFFYDKVKQNPNFVHSIVNLIKQYEGFDIIFKWYKHG